MSENKDDDMISKRALVNIEKDAAAHIGRGIEVATAIRIHESYRKLSEYALILKFNEARESKCYKGLPYTDENGNELAISTIQQFCEHYLNVSYNVLHEKSQQLNLLGDEAFNGATELGLTRSTLRTIERLPKDKQETMQMALKARNKDKVAEILEDVITRNEKESAQNKKRIAELEGDLAGTEKVLQQRNETLTKLEKQLVSKKTADWDRKVQEFSLEAIRISQDIQELLDRFDKLRDVFLNEDFGEDNDAAYYSMACTFYDTVQRIVKRTGLVYDNCEQTFRGMAFDEFPDLPQWPGDDEQV